MYRDDTCEGGEEGAIPLGQYPNGIPAERQTSSWSIAEHYHSQMRKRCLFESVTPGSLLKNSIADRPEVGDELLGLLAERVPDGVELPPDDLIKRLEEALVDGEVFDVDLVGPPELLEAGVHGIEDSGLDAPHRLSHGDADVDDLGRGALEVSGSKKVEAGPKVEASNVEALHSALRLGEAGDHGMGAIGEGINREEVVVAEEEEEGADVGGEEAGGEEVGDEGAGGEEERGAGGVEGDAVVGGEVGGHVVDLQLQERRLALGVEEEAPPDLSFDRLGGGEDQEAAIVGGLVEELEEDGGRQGGHREATRNHHQAAVGVLQEVRHHLLLEGKHHAGGGGALFLSE
uniref:Uncharacterized protein n=1 Tax=Oryza barthii TaxID=65489 RepID=A0A0D3FCK5_9ORYZ